MSPKLSPRSPIQHSVRPLALIVGRPPKQVWQLTLAHPFLTGVNRLAAARWLGERGDVATAERLLTWHQAVLFPMQDTREANTIMEPLAYLEQARVAEALGRRDLARTYYRRFLWRYDAPPPQHGSLVQEARSALARLGG